MGQLRAEPFVSVIAPVHNAGPAFASGVLNVLEVLSAHYTNFELIIVDDGSTTGSINVLDTVMESHRGVRIIKLVHPHGLDIAASAGLDSSIGDYVIVMDLTSDPADLIPTLIERCQKTGGVLYGVVRNPQQSILRNLGGRVFQWYCRNYLNIDIQRSSALFRVFDRTAVNNFTQIKDRSRIMRMMTANLGVPVRPFHYEMKSKSHYLNEKQGFFESLNLAFDIMVATSRHPLRWVSRLGVLAALINVVYVAYIVLVYLIKDEVAEGWVTLSMQNAVMFLLLSVVLTILCEYVGKLVVESQEKPLYSVIEERNSTILIDTVTKNIVNESTSGIC